MRRYNASGCFLYNHLQQEHDYSPRYRTGVLEPYATGNTALIAPVGTEIPISTGVNVVYPNLGEQKLRKNILIPSFYLAFVIHMAANGKEASVYFICRLKHKCPRNGI